MKTCPTFGNSYGERAAVADLASCAVPKGLLLLQHCMPHHIDLVVHAARYALSDVPMRRRAGGAGRVTAPRSCGRP